MIPEILFNLQSCSLLVTSSLIMGMSRGGLGGGLGLLGVLIAAQVLNPIAAAVFLLPILIITDPISVYIYHRSIDWRSLKELMPGVIIGVVLGAILISGITPNILQTIIGALSLSLVFNGVRDYFGKTKVTVLSKKWGFGLGTLAGFSSFLIHAGLPPVAAYILPKKMPRSEFMGTTAVFFFITNLIKLIPYFALGMFTFELIKLTIIMVPISLLGIWIGKFINGKISDKWFYFLVYSSVFFLGIRLIILSIL
jgi:uncharacterized membrane protein YfcA